MEYFVGFQIEQDPFTGSIFIHQTKYIDDIIDCFGMKDAYPISTPIELMLNLATELILPIPQSMYHIKRLLDVLHTQHHSLDLMLAMPQV